MDRQTIYEVKTLSLLSQGDSHSRRPAVTLFQVKTLSLSSQGDAHTHPTICACDWPVAHIGRRKSGLLNNKLKNFMPVAQNVAVALEKMFTK